MWNRQALSRSNGSTKSRCGKLVSDPPFDRELIRSIANGDQRAMNALFDRHQVQVYRFALRILNDKGLAEDVTAETFCQIWSGAAASFRGDARVSTWLLTIARNQAISMLRRRSHQELDEANAEKIEDLADNPEVAFAKLQQGAIIAHCLNSLLPEHRDPIAYFYFQGKSVEEVAKIVGIPRSAVKARMFRGRKLMAELLKRFDIACADSMADGHAPRLRIPPSSTSPPLPDPMPESA
jgi:RNA polymerase sigma-70 factor, ECF subfamily